MGSSNMDTERARESFNSRILAMRERLKVIKSRKAREAEDTLGSENWTNIHLCKGAAIAMLDHPSAEFRMAALAVLSRRWQIAPTDSCITRIVEIALFDLDIGARVNAISSLGTAFVGTDDNHVGRLFATIVLDAGKPCQLRYMSYFGLLRLKRRSLLRMADFPDHIDYGYVNDFLRDDRVPRPANDDEDQSGGVISRWERLREESRARMGE